MKSFHAIAAATLLLTACADTVPVDQFEPDRSVAELSDNRSGSQLGAADAQAAPNKSPAMSLDLQSVSGADFGAAIAPDRSCTFTSASGQMLLVAEAPEGIRSRPRAVVRLSAVLRSLDAMRDGGYNYLTEGPAFQNRQGLTITVVRDESTVVPQSPAVDPAPDASATPGAQATSDSDATATPAQSWPATMTVITEGAEQEYPQGIYSCGT